MSAGHPQSYKQSCMSQLRSRNHNIVHLSTNPCISNAPRSKPPLTSKISEQTCPCYGSFQKQSMVSGKSQGYAIINHEYLTHFVIKYLSCSGEADDIKYLPSIFTQLQFTFFCYSRFHCQYNYDADAVIHHPCHWFLQKCYHDHQPCNLHFASSLLAGPLIH